MATPANYVKVGLFVVLGFAAALALAIGLGATQTRHVTVDLYTYFNESVEGLEVGSPVTFRGVRVGRVGDITIAPDRRLVEVRMAIDVGSMEQLGLVPRGEFERTHVFPEPPSDLRAQIGSLGLTANKYVAVDFFDPKTNPPPELSFPPMKHYIPAATSLTKGLEDALTKAMDHATEFLEHGTKVVDGVGRIVEDLERGGAGPNAASAIAQANDTLRNIDHLAKGVERAKIVENGGATVASLHVAADDLTNLMRSIEGDHGLVATTQRSVSSFGEASKNVGVVTRDLDATLSDIREAAAAFRELADELGRQPDMLIKGRAAARGP
jgi:phospholipid/cholesterol/gamma-HCH transport system substrate-binding protein